MSDTAVTSTASEDAPAIRAPIRWHIAVFLAPALLIYTAVMVIPLVETLRLSFFKSGYEDETFVGLGNFKTLLFDERWVHSFWNALINPG